MPHSTEARLLDMLEINGKAFMDAVMEMRRIRALLDQAQESDWLHDPVQDDGRAALVGYAEELIASIQQLYANVAHVAAVRLRDELQSNPSFRWQQLREAVADIESRLRDELGMVKLFVLHQGQSIYLAPGADLMGQQVADRIPSVLFETEEAARCLALGRSTASAFHSMRALEVGIRALAKFLEIPDPTKPAERNWGTVLRTISERIDEKYPNTARLPGSEGAEVEALYATLDAVKNPWRNATMHTENVYQPHEADHILKCVNFFILKLSALCNEDGEKIPVPPLSLPFDAVGEPGT